MSSVRPAPTPIDAGRRTPASLSRLGLDVTSSGRTDRHGLVASVTPPDTAEAASAQRAADAKLNRALDELVAMPGDPPGAIAVVQRGNRIKVFSVGAAEVGTD